MLELQGLVSFGVSPHAGWYPRPSCTSFFCESSAGYLVQGNGKDQIYHIYAWRCGLGLGSWHRSCNYQHGYLSWIRQGAVSCRCKSASNFSLHNSSPVLRSSVIGINVLIISVMDCFEVLYFAVVRRALDLLLYNSESSLIG